MATFDFIQVAPAGNGTSSNTIYAATLGASANSGVITTGFDMIIRVVASNAVTIRFGPSATLTAATATDIYLPANTPYVVDMGHYQNAISIFAISASTVVTVNLINKN